MILRHFGQSFDRSECHRSCDNCLNQAPAQFINVTEAAQAILRIVSAFGGGAAGSRECKEVLISEIFRGSKAKSCTQWQQSEQHKTQELS